MVLDSGRVSGSVVIPSGSAARGARSSSGGKAGPQGAHHALHHHQHSHQHIHHLPAPAEAPEEWNASGTTAPGSSTTTFEPPTYDHTVQPGASNGTPPQQHVVNYHINQGEMVSLELGDGQLRVISGPAQIRMVSTNSGPPQAIPMQPPPGHIVQQILDQNGTLQHVILSLDPSVNPPPPPPPGGANTPFVPLHPYGLPSGGSCISNGQSGAHHPPFGPPPSASAAAYVPSAGHRPGGGSSGHSYPPPVISPVPSAVAASSCGGGTTTSWSSTTGGGSNAGCASHPERRPRGPTHERLLRKSRHRLMGGVDQSSAPHSPPRSPSKRNIGRGESKVYGRKDNKALGAMDDSEESGVGHEEEEDKETQQLLLELLSNIQAPKESNVTSRGAVISWEPPEIDSSNPKFEGLEPIPPSEFTYEVLLSDKGKEGRYRSVFKDESLNCRLPDLRPNTEYHIRIHALLDNLKGGASDTVSFRTLPSEPDTPFPPKVASKSKTSINLRWNAPSDNGSSIQNYILEYDEGKSSPFVPLFSGRSKSYNVTKLSSATPYRFRLIAVNEYGASRPSEALVVITQGAPPSRPTAPGLTEATKSSLHLLWSKRLSDAEFVLQQNDMTSGHGYISVYSGPDYAALSTGLRRNTPYKFRLRACNSEGESQWSEEVTYSTLPDKPGPPGKVAPKGKLHSHSFKVRWDPPSDDGGSMITQYNLELDEGNGWRTVYQGPELDSVCDGLSPGKQYAVRVSCQSSGGVSDYSDTLTIHTEPVKPGQCPPPRLHGKPKADHLYLKWSWPESDGGARISEFEIDMTSPDNTTCTAYKGIDTECAVASLLPGRPYLFQVRAYNRAGPGPWSDTLEVVSGAGAPGQPKEPKFTVKSSSAVLFSWEAPINNGALITEYTLELANLTPRFEQEESDKESDREDEDLAVEAEVEEDSDDSSFSEEDDDEESDDDFSRDSPSSENYDSGDSEDSSEKKSQSKSSPKKISVASSHVKRVMEPKEPEFVTVYTGPNSSFEVRSLLPASTYLFRLAAFNSAGKGPYSECVSKVSTPSAPPAQITSVRVRERGSTWLNLSWKAPDSQGEDISVYRIDIGSGLIWTQGPVPEIHLYNLKPDSSVSVRIQAVNSVGSGPFSQTHRFTTRPLPPAPPRIEGINANHNSLKLKWGDAKSMGLLHYTLEMENSRHQFQPVYSGSMVSHKVNKLSENTAYRFRIMASNEAGQGPYSSIIELSTLYAHPPPLKCAPRVSSITSDGCLVEWTPLKHQLQGVLQYKVSLTKVKEQTSKIIYSGVDPSFRVSGLEARTEYSIRVLSVRIPAPGIPELVGSSSSPGIFTTLGGDPSQVGGVSSSGLLGSSGKASSSFGSQKPEKKAFSDQQWAFLILVGFSVFAMFVAVLMHQIIGWSKDDESGD